MAAKTTSFLYNFLLQIIARFLVSARFWVDKFMSHVFRSKGLLFDLQIQNVYHQQTNESVFMNVNYNITNNIC